MSHHVDEGSLEVGITETGERIYLTEEERQTHMQVIGTTGTGKTKFFEHCIRQDIERGRGVCVLDPTGNLYNNLVRWCETHYLHDEREIVLIDPTEDEWVFGFNPLAFDAVRADGVDVDKLAFATAATRAAVQRAWGEAKNVYAPLLRRLLNLLIYTLAEHQLTIPEGQLLMHPDPESAVRAYLTRMLRSRVVRNEWEGLASMRPYEYESLFGSVRNRLFEFLLQPRLATMLAQNSSMKFRKAMDEGHVVLVNLSTGGDRVYGDVGKLIGGLMVNAMVLGARGRTDTPEQERRPFYLYIDECHRYLNDDTAEILDELRQFRLHVVLAHQDLTQLREDGSERIYKAIMGQARTKVVFQCPDEDDADRMAKRIFRGAIDFEEPKHALDKPVPTGTHRKEVLHGKTEAENAGEPGESTTQVEDADGNATAQSVTRNEGQSTRVSGRSEQETLVPDYKIMATSVYSLPEQYERKAAEIANLRKRHAIVKRPEGPAQAIGVPNVEEGYASDERVRRFKKQKYEKHAFIQPRVEAEKVMQERLDALVARALAFKESGGRVLEGQVVPVVKDVDPLDND